MGQLYIMIIKTVTTAEELEILRKWIRKNKYSRLIIRDDLESFTVSSANRISHGKLYSSVDIWKTDNKELFVLFSMTWSQYVI